MVRPDGFHSPKDGEPNDGNVERRQRQVAHAELDRRKGDVRDQVDGERNRDEPRDLLAGNTVEDIAKRDQDDRVKDLPNQTDRRWLRRPSRFVECVVPVSPGHG